VLDLSCCLAESCERCVRHQVLQLGSGVGEEGREGGEVSRRVVGLYGCVGGFCGVDFGRVDGCGVELVDEIFEESDFLAKLVELAGIVVVGIYVVVGISGVGVGIGVGMHVIGVGVRGGERERGGEEEGDREDDGEELHHD
jgi:hypothetical protein